MNRKLLLIISRRYSEAWRSIHSCVKSAGGKPADKEAPLYCEQHEVAICVDDTDVLLRNEPLKKKPKAVFVWPQT